jgi:NDP-sugar pyrophosphorylase family protein
MTEGVYTLPKHRRTRRRPVSSRPAKAVVLAGGRGTRLAPYTSVLPKPLMPIGDRSILELVIAQLEASGIVDITLSVGYLAHLIKAVLEGATPRKAEVSYVHEQQALGTAAPLKLVEGLDGTFIAMNGDVLTTLDFRNLVRTHRRENNLLTIATRRRSVKIDYGVLQLDAQRRVRRYDEKPELQTTVSMGIYVLEPEALDYVPDQGYFDFPDLVKALLAAGRPVGTYAFDGLWFDIGRREDYEQAVEAWVAETGAEVRNGAVSHQTAAVVR